ncbi:hypothetical protein GEV33_003298 [Tenebrio molitor]|uniref:Uncharacterized protein n=1 Tax=Tenebrio molitor TaxID=7067 RepID=A0A8J6HSL9_TENMO|nr:hypothetical protein GEV33_003298 [Tenebrio molitor]
MLPDCGTPFHSTLSLVSVMAWKGGAGLQRDNNLAGKIQREWTLLYVGILPTLIDCTFFDRRQTQRQVRQVRRELICKALHNVKQLRWRVYVRHCAIHNLLTMPPKKKSPVELYRVNVEANPQLLHVQSTNLGILNPTTAEPPSQNAVVPRPAESIVYPIKTHSQNPSPFSLFGRKQGPIKRVPSRYLNPNVYRKLLLVASEMPNMGILGGPVMIIMGIENSISGEHRLIAPQHVLCEALVFIDLVEKPIAKSHLLEELVLLCNGTSDGADEDNVWSIRELLQLHSPKFKYMSAYSLLPDSRLHILTLLCFTMFCVNVKELTYDVT